MSTFDLNLDFGEDTVGGGLVDEGMVVLRIDDVTVKPTKSDQTRNNIVFKATAVWPEDQNNRRPIFFQNSLEKESRWALKDTLEAITGQDWAEDGMSLNPRELVGLLVQATIVHEVYQGKTNAKVQSLFRHDG